VILAGVALSFVGAARAAGFVELAPAAGVPSVAAGAASASVAPALGLSLSAPLTAPAADARPPLAAPAQAVLDAHLNFLRALPGARSVAVSPRSWEIGRPVDVVFNDLESLRAGRAAAADRLEYWSRVLPDRDKAAQAAGLPADAPAESVDAAYARLLERMEGVTRVLTGAYDFGARYFDVSFRDQASAEAFMERERVPHQASGRPALKGLEPHPVTFSVADAERQAHLERLENSYAERLAAISGVLSVGRESHPGGMGNPPTVVFTPVFEDHDALDRAKDAGLLPSSFPTIPEYLWDVDYYAVQPRALKAPERAAYRAASKAIARKGGEYSSDDYRLARDEARARLAHSGANAAALKLFDRLCDEAPVRGGKFRTLFD